jgi:hypothetical protein
MKYLLTLEEYREEIDFPIKKILYIIKSHIDGKIEENETSYFMFNFLDNKYLPIKFKLAITWDKDDSIIDYFGYVNQNEVKNSKFKQFRVNVEIIDKELDYYELYSIINHELKHVYDMYHNINYINDVLDTTNIEEKYKDSDVFSSVIHLCYAASIHEMDARKSMLYDKLRWLKLFDKDYLIEEFKKSYIYKESMNLIHFDYTPLFTIDKHELFLFTKDLVSVFYKMDIDENFDLKKFYENLAVNFKTLSEKHLKKCYKVIDELIEDNSVYTEQQLTTNPWRNIISHQAVQKSIDNVFGDLIGKENRIFTFGENWYYKNKLRII